MVHIHTSMYIHTHIHNAHTHIQSEHLYTSNKINKCNYLMLFQPVWASASLNLGVSLGSTINPGLALSLHSKIDRRGLSYL